MKITNIQDPEWRRGSDPPGYQCRYVQLGGLLGAHTTGMSVYELPPGQAICPYHYECGEEEWLIVVQGRPVLRHPAGETELGLWDVVFFPVGPDGAHKVINTTDETVRVLMFSDVVTPTVTVYPDSGKVNVLAGDGTPRLIVRQSDGVDYWDGETPERDDRMR